MDVYHDFEGIIFKSVRSVSTYDYQNGCSYLGAESFPFRLYYSSEFFNLSREAISKCHRVGIRCRVDLSLLIVEGKILNESNWM